MGVSWNDFWVMNPRIIKAISRGYAKKIQQQDYLSWMNGQYTLSAVSVAVEHCLAGKKAKSKYIEEPFMAKAFEYDGLTEEEIQEKEIRKAILIEQQYMAMSINNGLPETVIE